MARSRTFILICLLFFVVLTSVPGVATGQAHESAAHSDPVTPVILALAVILTAAKFAGHLAVRFGQPAVLGELVAGVALGSADLLGLGWFHAIETDATVEILARIGVLILLFEVGLESTVGDMLKVGLPSLFVAVLGVAAPFALGWGVGALMLPDRSPYVHAFLGATLTATSVGNTARVLRDLGRSQTREARIILGAAVIDDVLGLVILAIVAGMITTASTGGTVSYLEIALVLGKAVVFLVGSFWRTSISRISSTAATAASKCWCIQFQRFSCRSSSSSWGCVSISPRLGAWMCSVSRHY